MRTLYSVQFGIVPEACQTIPQCFADLERRTWRWVQNKYVRTQGIKINPLQGTCEFIPALGHKLRVTNLVIPEGHLFSLEWIEPRDADPSNDWSTVVVLAHDDNAVELSIQCRIIARQMVIRPTAVTLRSPGLVRDVLSSYEATCGNWKIAANWLRVDSLQVDTFVNLMLRAEDRTLPIVVVSPDGWSGRHLVNLNNLTEELRGVATVAALIDKWAAFKLTDVVGGELSCFNGAIRVYWPGFDLNDDPFRHRLYLPHVVKERETTPFNMAHLLFRQFAAISSIQFVDGVVTRKIRSLAANHEATQNEILKEQVRSGRLNNSELQDKLLDALIQIEELTAERGALRADLEAQQSAWAELQQAPQAAEAPQIVQPEAAPETLEQVVRRFSAGNHPGVMLLESTFTSAADSPFKKIERVGQLLEALAEITAKWKKQNGKLGESWEAAFGRYGFEYKDKISQTTRGKWKADYEFPYKGKKRLFENHVTIGSGQADTCLSVHWLRDEDDLLIVIAHCGRHLTNTRS